MSLIPVVGDDSDNPMVREAFSRTFAERGKVINLYRVLANAPELLGPWIDFGSTLRTEPGVPRALRELSILRVAQLTAARYEWDSHCTMAVAAGVPVAQIEALAQWHSATVFDDDQRAVLAMTDELTLEAGLDEPTRRSLVERFGETGTVELVVTAAFYSCVSRILRGLDVPAEPDAAPEVPFFDPHIEPT
jgi:4-carboxymuconolactone decarboxylase